MTEEKRPTETEQINILIKRGYKVVSALAQGALTHFPDSVKELSAVLGEIAVANEARDRSRKLSVDVTAYDFTEPLVAALLAQGFDLAVAGCVAQFHTIDKSGPCTSWTPPLNPFRRSGAAEETTTGVDGVAVTSERKTPKTPPIPPPPVEVD